MTLKTGMVLGIAPTEKNTPKYERYGFENRADYKRYSSFYDAFTHQLRDLDFTPIGYTIKRIILDKNGFIARIREEKYDFDFNKRSIEDTFGLRLKSLEGKLEDLPVLNGNVAITYKKGEVHATAQRNADYIRIKALLHAVATEVLGREIQK